MLPRCHAGLVYDRFWMVSTKTGRLVSQRVVSKLALVDPVLSGDALRGKAGPGDALGQTSRRPQHPDVIHVMQAVVGKQSMCE